jgi:hypothetical protein
MLSLCPNVGTDPAYAQARGQQLVCSLEGGGLGTLACWHCPAKATDEKKSSDSEDFFISFDSAY